MNFVLKIILILLLLKLEFTIIKKKITMKHLIYIAFFAIIIFITTYIGNNNPGYSYTSGSPSGYTGSPYDGKTCTYCHTIHVGTALHKDGMLTSDIPITGFFPDSIYTITATVSSPGTNKFGFIASPHDVSGNASGELFITNSTETKIVGSYYVTHTSNGISGADNEKSWSFDWKAPSNLNEVTFYAAFTAGDKYNDSTFYTSMTVTKNTVNIIEINSEKSYIKVYPSPAKNNIYISVFNILQGNYTIAIFDSKGNIVIEGIQFIIDTNNYKFKQDVSSLSRGIYFLTLKGEKEEKVFKMLIQ